MPRSYFPTPTSPKHKKYMQEQQYGHSSSVKSYYQDSISGSVSTASVSTTTKSYDQNAFDPWKDNNCESGSPLSVLDNGKLDREPEQRTGIPDHTESHAKNANQPFSKRIVPGVSKMNMRQTLAIVFSAYWDRADLYMDVLGLEHDNPTERELKVAFFRQGREVIATPIESPDDATMLTYGRAPFLKESGGGSTISVVQRGVPVSRKAKLRFQAIGLAYDLLCNPTKRSMYDKWRLFNGRLPEPKSVSRSVRASANERIRMQEAKESPATFSVRNVRRPNMTSINEMDEFPKEQSNKTKQTYMFADSNHSNVQSILRKSAGMRARNNISDASASSRKISWNEEVEELTLMEEILEDSSNSHLPFLPFGEKRNSRNIPDPYGKSAEDWFGDVDNAWSKSVESAITQNKFSSKTMQSYNSELNERGYEDIQENNIQSLNSNVLIGGFGEDQDNSCEYDDKPDDSFLVIMNGPWGGNDQRQESKTKAKNRKNPDQYALGDEWTNYNDDENFRPMPSRNSSVKGKNQNASKYKGRKDNSIGVTVISQDTPFCTGTPKRKSTLSNRTQEMNSDRSNQIPLSNIPVDPIEEDASLLTNDFTNSWTSNPTADDYFDTEYDNNDCNGIGHTVDIARGFQATLSKYITAAVEDMKEGLAIVGQNWDDLDKPDAPRKDNKNFFTLEAFELDAMMGILKTEMNKFNDQFAGCGSPDDADLISTSHSRNSVSLSKDKSFGSAYGTTVFKANSLSTKPKKGIRKRLARFFSRKTKA
jgi:curved DNA-binding protein CbpA